MSLIEEALTKWERQEEEVEEVKEIFTFTLPSESHSKKFSFLKLRKEYLRVLTK